MTIAPLEERLAIQELGARYAFRCDTGRYSEIAELFAEDGIFDETVIGLPLCSGREAIAAFFPSMAPMIGYLIHLSSNHQLTAYDGMTAASTTHLHVEASVLGNPVRILGYYDDRYAKVDGSWLFTRRTLVEIAPTTGMPPLG